MSSKFKGKSLWLAIVGLTFVSSWLLGDALRKDGQAATLPGIVPQSGSHAHQGVTVEVEEAVFSASAVDVRIRVAFGSSDREPAGVGPTDARLAGATATSAVHSSDGRTVLRFPALPEVGSIATATLSVAAVQLLSSDGRIERVPGTWSLDIVLPTGDDAQAAKKLEALRPTLVETSGYTILVEGYRTSAATVLRYRLPSQLFETRPPTVSSGSDLLEPTRSDQQADGMVELWFEATKYGTPLSVNFEGLQSSEPSPSHSVLRARIEPFAAPPARAPDAPAEDYPLSWQPLEQPEGLTLQKIVWHRDISGVTILLTIGGIWNPTLGGKPELVGDGAPLFVRGVVNYPSTGNRGDETTIEAVLPDGITPLEVVLTVGGESAPVEAAQATLQP